MIPIGQFEVDGCHLDGGVGKVVVQDLHGILELVSCDHIYVVGRMNWELTVLIEMVVGE